VGLQPLRNDLIRISKLENYDEITWNKTASFGTEKALHRLQV